jgi:hypothetical protein
MYFRRKVPSQSGCCPAVGHNGPSTNTNAAMCGASGGCATSTTTLSNKSSCNYNTNTNTNTNNKLFQPGVKLIVRRAPIITGVISAGLCKKFQRPMLQRRAYDKNADAALQAATLGPRRRMNGMAKIMSRAGKGLLYKSSSTLAGNALKGDNDDDDTGSSSEDDENKQEDRPFEPLCLWISPHQEAAAASAAASASTTGEDAEGDAGNGRSTINDTSFLLHKGLPPRIVTITREDEYGVEEQVQVLQPAPLHLYSKENIHVPPVLAKWLRPHQREGVQFMYECVMGLRGFKGHGWYVGIRCISTNIHCNFFSFFSSGLLFIVFLRVTTTDS